MRTKFFVHIVIDRDVNSVLGPFNRRVEADRWITINQAKLEEIGCDYEIVEAHEPNSWLDEVLDMMANS